MLNDPIVIVSAARTPMGAFQGELKGFAAPELGAAAIRAAVERAKISPEDVQEVLMGCVLPAGQGQAPARQAALGPQRVRVAQHGQHLEHEAVDHQPRAELRFHRRRKSQRIAVGAAIDALVDVVGVCAGLRHFGVRQLVCTAPPAGHGSVLTAHGRLPVPAPAVLELARRRGVPLAASGDFPPAELTTPAGLTS